MNINNIRDESMGPNPRGEPPDEDEDEFEVIKEPDLIYYCQRMKDGETCDRNGQCIRFLFNEGRFDDCDALIMEDADEGEEDFALDMGDN